MAEASEGSNNVPNQLAILVPSFDPSRDDLQVYTQKVMLLLEAWPSNKYTELATRLILNCGGSAFKKLQLHQSEVTQNDKKSIHRIIELLGGHWGQIDLEQKYEYAERALYKCSQKSDESADSYLARADIMWTELNSRKFQLSDLQAYVTLRGSVLTAEDKKRVLLDSDAASKGDLTVAKVSAAIRMLGASFFQEMTTGRRVSKQKTYDQSTLLTEDLDEAESDQPVMSAEVVEDDDTWVDVLVQEGDEDASLVQDFEAAAMEVVQTDEELAAAFTAYTDARRRLNEKVRSRGFWPIGQKGKSEGFQKGVKGKFSKSHPSSRKSLQQRILESRCRLCGKVGHWKAECPSRGDSSASANRPHQAPTSFVQVSTGASSDADQGLPLEFLNLPMHGASSIDVSQHDHVDVFMMVHQSPSKDRLRKSLSQWKSSHEHPPGVARNDGMLPTWRTRLVQRARPDDIKPETTAVVPPEPEVACFASHGSHGIVDLGATKTVIGGNLVKGLLEGLDPNLRKQVFRCPCEITFRFGNHGVLQSQQALVIPIHGLQLKVAIVPGSTPFLLSNTLLRTLGATIDTENKTMYSKRLDRKFPLMLTSKGLFLLDVNELAQQPPGNSKFSEPAETHQMVSEDLPCPRVCKRDLPTAPNASNQDEMFSHGRDGQQADAENMHVEEATRFHSSSPRSKRFPKSFQVLAKSSHVQPCSPPSADPDACQRDAPRHDASVPRPAEESEDHIRPHPHRPIVPAHVGQRAGVDHMGCAKILGIHQSRASHFPSLRRAGSGTCRAHRNTGASDQPEGHRESDDHQQLSDLADASHSSAQGQGQEPAEESSRSECLGGGRGSRVVRSHPIRAECDGPIQHHESRESHPGNRECPDGHHAAHREPGKSSPDRAVRDSGCPSMQAFQTAGDPSADCFYNHDQSTSTQTNSERIKFQRLINQYTDELRNIQANTNVSTKRTDVFEVFCGNESQLTKQSQQLGFRADRFSRQQGDLQTTEGRHLLFQRISHQNPKNIWFSPSCGPWSGFACLNGSRSLDAWDALQQTRMLSVEQIALGVVLLRHQRSGGNHFHWEQPRGSLMFKLPYLQEALHYLLAVDVDLCVAGELKDPTNGKLIKKTLTILSTSRRMINALTGLRCHHQHEHQTIKGQIQVNGVNMNRSTFTENYPRKFARRLAIIMGKVQFPREEPYRNEMWSILAAEEHPEAPVSKRPRRERYTSLKLSRSREVSQLLWGKRQKCVGKTTPIDTNQQWQEIFNKVHQVIPRVGKMVIQEQSIISAIQSLMTDKKVETIVACRGASRTLAPPPDLVKGVAPLRRSIFSERGTGELRAEEEWENWEQLAKRNLIRPSHATRINITVFAQKIPEARTNIPEAARPPTDQEVSAENRDACPEQPGNSEAVQSPGQLETANPGQSPTEDRPAMSTGLTSSQQVDSLEQSQGSRFKALPRDEEIALIRAHKNLGHPSPERLSTILRSQGYRPEVSQAALELRCSVCQAKALPKLSRPGALKDDLDFNDRICIDGCNWTNSQGKTFHMYHIVDWATNFQVARIAPDKSTPAAINTIIDMWLSWAGNPSEMLVDAGTEFNSEEFSIFTQSHNIKLTPISPEAHYQNGKAERHGAILKTMLSKYDLEHPITQYQELSQAIFWCTQAKNSSSLKRGYAPEVLVLGKHTRLPGAVCSDEMLPAHLLADSETAHGVAFRRQLAYREAARKAFVTADNDAALRRAMLRRSRPGGQNYAPGEWVMC